MAGRGEERIVEGAGQDSEREDIYDGSKRSDWRERMIETIGKNR